MRNILKCGTALISVMTAAAMSASLTAQAADISRLPVKPPVVVAPSVWNGVYVGVHTGAFYNSSTLVDPDGTLVDSLTVHNGSYFLGGFAGVNYQIANLVVGVEGDYSAVLGGAAVSPPVYFVGLPTFYVTGTSDAKWVATIAARLGLAVGNFLIYAKGGGAWTHVTYTSTVQNDAQTVSLTDSASATHTGWLAGAGLELAWTPNILTRLEYNYIDFGTKTLRSSQDLFTIDVESSAHVVKTGIAFKFGY